MVVVVHKLSLRESRITAGRLGPLERLPEVDKRAFRLVYRPALDGQHYVPFRLLADSDYLFPVNHSVAASASDRRARDFAAFVAELLFRNVFGVQMDEAIDDAFKP